MSGFLSAIFAAVLRAFAPGTPPSAPVAAKPAGTQISAVTSEGLKALEMMFGPIVDILRGKGTLADGEEVANAIANIVAVLNPADAAAIAMIEAAEPAAAYLFGVLKNGGAFAPAPRGGPPIAEADWSHGFPQPQPVDNPSGAIGGAWPHPDP